KEVRIVHGHGKGILRAAVAEVLRENKLVKSAGPAPPHQGGAGATVVIFKD
nr:DNA mismatch repair protein MutS [Bacillota bacterium]